MVSTGMIFQYDSTQGTGLLMLSDGETKEFSSNDWTDTVNSPAIGQKISYLSDAHGTQIKVAGEEDTSKALADTEKEGSKEENISKNTMDQFTSVDDYLKYFTDMGFKQVKDIQNTESRTLTLRMYTPNDYGEAIIEQIGSKISVTQILNGKPVAMN